MFIQAYQGNIIVRRPDISGKQANEEMGKRDQVKTVRTRPDQQRMLRSGPPR